jgi:hypothetical protein
MVQLILRIVGGLAIVAAFFFGTLFVLDYTALKYPDSLRAAHAKSFKAALERYHSARGYYPYPFPNNVLSDLKKELVDSKYLDVIPVDPSGMKEKEYYYVSNDGKTYGMLFHLQFPVGKIPAEGTCITGVGTAGTGWWNQPPDCPF